MDVDDFNNVMDFDSEMAFGGTMANGHAVDSYGGYGMDEIVMGSMTENARQEMLMLEDFIKDSAYE